MARGMLGGNSIQLARIFGVRIGVDVSWFFVLFLIIFSLSTYYAEVFPGEQTKAYVLAVVSALLFFGSVLLHELGHAVVAMRNGIGIRGIDLWLFGGVAKMEKDTDTPGVEFRVAVAGPAVTLVLAVVFFAAASLVGGAGDAAEATGFTNEAVGGTVAVLGYLAFVNTVLLLFNLIPGFPLDGGRIARAIAWWRTGDRTRATRFAARLGRGFAVLMIAAGAAWWLLAGNAFGGIWLAFVGFFLRQAATQAEQQAVVTGRIEGVRVADVMDSEPVAVPDTLSAEQAWDEFFLRYGWPWFPVVDPDGRLVGLVTREAVEALPADQRATRTVRSAMAGDSAGSSFRVGLEEPLEALLGREGLARLGAIMAVDAEGVLRGIVTVEQVRDALRTAAPVSP